MLNIFNGKTAPPDYQLVRPRSGKLQTLTISKETAKVRPYAAGAILRGIEFTPARYASFIALQDKLHQNLARQRSLVAIGTHDLDTIEGPFTYDAIAPRDFSFVPLNQTKSMTGAEMMDFYEKDKNLGRYLHIIKEAPVYPLIRDANKTICSMPPIINGDHSKITLKTKNVFIDTTATDRTKLSIVLDIICTMFAMYTEKPFTVEPIQVISEHNGETRVTPELTYRPFVADIPYLNECCGLNLSADEICTLLKRMAYDASPDPTSKDRVLVKVPPTRADVLHQADIMEDLAIAYGFNKLPRAFPKVAGTVAQPLKINKLADIVRNEAAMAGWSEVMPLILCSHDENFAWLNHKDDGNTAVKLANPKTQEYQMIRTSLVPGLLKTIRENKHHALPLKLFEVSEVAFKDESRERKSRNERHFAAAWCSKNSGFEVVHGLMDRVMLMLKSAFITKEEGIQATDNGYASYWIEEVDGKCYKLELFYTLLILHRPHVLRRSCGSCPCSCGWAGPSGWNLWHLASHGTGKVRFEIPRFYTRDQHRGLPLNETLEMVNKRSSMA